MGVLIWNHMFQMSTSFLILSEHNVFRWILGYSYTAAFNNWPSLQMQFLQWWFLGCPGYSCWPPWSLHNAFDNRPQRESSALKKLYLWNQRVHYVLCWISFSFDTTLLNNSIFVKRTRMLRIQSRWATQLILRCYMYSVSIIEYTSDYKVCSWCWLHY